MNLCYKNLSIRKARPADGQLLCDWWNDGRVMAHAGYPNGLGTTVDAVIEGIEKQTDDTYRRLIIEYGSTPVGEMSYRNMGGQVAQIGIKICDFSMQEKGLGTNYLKMLISHLFEKGYEKIILDTNIENKRAQHVYEKIGFSRVQVRQNAFKDQLGIPQTAVDYQLYKKDFRGILD